MGQHFRHCEQSTADCYELVKGKRHHGDQWRLTEFIAEDCRV